MTIAAEKLQRYADHIVNDYHKWSKSDRTAANFHVTFEPGSKFIRVVTSSYDSRSSHSFIVAKDTPKWKAGTILMSASWKAPAQNFARGHLDDAEYKRVSWTGAH